MADTLAAVIDRPAITTFAIADFAHQPKLPAVPAQNVYAKALEVADSLRDIKRGNAVWRAFEVVRGTTRRQGMVQALFVSGVFAAGAVYTATHWGALAAMDQLFNGLIPLWGAFMFARCVGGGALQLWAEVRAHPRRMPESERVDVGLVASGTGALDKGLAHRAALCATAIQSLRYGGEGDRATRVLRGVLSEAPPHELRAIAELLAPYQTPELFPLLARARNGEPPLAA